MAGSRRRRQLNKQREDAANWPDSEPVMNTAAADADADAIRVNFVELLPQEILTKIYGHFTLLDRLAFAVVCKTAGHPITKVDTTTTTPWLIFPGETEEKASFFSLAHTIAVPARTADLGTRGHVIVGSSFGWLATADDQARLHIVDPFTGERMALPDIRTIPFFLRWSLDCGGIHIDNQRFLQIRYSGQLPKPDGNKNNSILPRSFSMNANHVRQWFYRKVVLSASPSRKSYAAMLILGPEYGVPAFATSEYPGWKVAPHRDGVEDAIHHNGRFYSVSYSGAVEAWERDVVTGEFTSKLIAPVRTIAGVSGFRPARKYIVALPDGRLAVVLKYTKEDEEKPRFSYETKKWACVFKVQVIVDAERNKLWRETRDIGNAALFVGMNSSICVLTTAAQTGMIKAGRIYFVDDVLCQAAEARESEATRYGHRNDGKPKLVDPQQVGVYVLRDGTVEQVEGLGPQHWTAPPVWFTPSV